MPDFTQDRPSPLTLLNHRVGFGKCKMLGMVKVCRVEGEDKE